MPARDSSPEIPEPQVSRPVVVGGVTYHVAGRRDRLGFAFWIEQPRGMLWRHLNRPAAHGRSLSPEREIVALTCGEPTMREVALACGWFEPTGRTLRHPTPQTNEIWALSPTALATLSAPAEAPQAQPDNLSPTLSAFLGIWVRGAVSHLQVTGVAILGPAPNSRSTDARVLLGVYPDRIKESARHLCAEGMRPPRSVEWYAAQPGAEAWLQAAAAIGPRTVMHVSIPAVAGRHFDCVMFGMPAANFTPLAAAALNAWREMAATLKVDSVLSERELACLQYTADGYTAEECAQAIGCSESNVRHHLSKAMRRLQAPNTVSAIQRAQLMGLLL